MVQLMRAREQESRAALLASEAKHRDLTSLVQTLQKERQRASEVMTVQKAELVRWSEAYDELETRASLMKNLKWRVAPNGEILIKVTDTTPKVSPEDVSPLRKNRGLWVPPDLTP